MSYLHSIAAGWMVNKYTSMPAKVVRFDFENQCVDIIPWINVVDTGTNDELQRPMVAAVPILFPCSSTSAITFPIKEGDFVLAVWSMRAVDLWKQNGSSSPTDFRMFDIQDAFAIPCTFPRDRVKTRHGQSPDDLVLVHNIGGGQNEIHLKANGDIVAKSPTTFKVECSEFVVDASNATINAPTAVNGTASISGKTTMSAGFDSNAASTVTGGIGIDGIQFGDHRHHYDDDGNDEITGVPI